MLMPVVNLRELWKRRGLRTAGIGLAVVLAVGGMGAAGYYLWPQRAPAPPPPAETASEEEARDYLAGDDFRRLPVDRRLEWVGKRMASMAEKDPEERRKAWESMDEETRRRIHENMREMMTERMNRDVETYHSLPPSEREKFLDERIDEMERRRPRGGRMRDGGGRGGPPPGGGRGPGPSGEQGRRPEGRRGPPPGGPMGHMARMPADKRAEFMAYGKAMMKRRMERGLGPPGPPGRGGGPGRPNR